MPKSNDDDDDYNVEMGFSRAEHDKMRKKRKKGTFDDSGYDPEMGMSRDEYEKMEKHRNGTQNYNSFAFKRNNKAKEPENDQGGCSTCNAILDKVEQRLGIHGKYDRNGGSSKLGFGLNNGKSNKSSSKTSMPKYKEVLSAYGGGIVGKGLSIVYAYGDKVAKTENNPVYARVWTWGNALTALGVLLYAGKKGGSMKETNFDALLGLGAVTLTEIADPLEKAVLGTQYTRMQRSLPYSSRYNVSGVAAQVPSPGQYRAFS